MAHKISGRRPRPVSRIVYPLVIAGILAGGLFVALLVFAARESDRVARERQTLLVARIVSGQIGKVQKNQDSVALWDEAIIHTKLSFDPGWIDSNLGVWMHDFFGTDQVFILSDQGASIYAMVDGKRVDASCFSIASTALTPLVAKLRRLQAASGNSPEERVTLADLLVIGNRPAIASIVPISSDTGKLTQQPGSEYLHISITFLDDAYLGHVSAEYLLSATRFAWNDDVAGDEAAFPMSKNSGTVIGYFVWKPDAPGRQLLTRMAPSLAGSLLAVVVIVGVLIRTLQHAARELNASEAEVQHLAFHDTLTGLQNRASFNNRLDLALSGARPPGQMLALLYLDLDGFKNINDTFGHPAGDELIREVGHRLAKLVRSSDTAARIGGDEFAIIQDGVVSQDSIVAISERIIKAVSRPISLGDASVIVGLSIGVAFATESAQDRSELIRKADRALYRAKQDGRNRVRFFADDMDTRPPNRRDLPSWQIA